MESSLECTFCRKNIIRRISTQYRTMIAAIDFMTGSVLEGYLPPKALAMVQEWISLHKEELKDIWETQDFRSISPLE